MLLLTLVSIVLEGVTCRDGFVRGAAAAHGGERSLVLFVIVDAWNGSVRRGHTNEGTILSLLHDAVELHCLALEGLHLDLSVPLEVLVGVEGLRSEGADCLVTCSLCRMMIGHQVGLATWRDRAISQVVEQAWRAPEVELDVASAPR